jgi:alpha-beta hydrolase superfamily lysophospholipase
MRKKFQFHVGYYDHLHPEPSINFQMNRWINYLGADALKDMQSISPSLSDFLSYRREFLALAEKALSQGRDLHAAYYFRSAEFFMRKEDPAKIPTRKKFLALANEQYGIDESQRFMVPYQDGDVRGLLPACHLAHDRPKDTIVLHGGYDSYIEEFYPFILYFHEAGYNVVCFEGPGQGGALLDAGLLLTHEWHKPVKAVLDYFHLEDVTLVGISFGACLALRAAALEPRIQRVVAYDVFLDWLDTTRQKLQPIAPLIMLLLKSKASGLFNLVLNGIMKKSPLFDWATHQALLVLGVSTPYQVFQLSRRYTTRDISSQVRQDVLLMAGAEDHIVPLGHYYEQLRILTQARSVTGRLFTRAEQAQNHSQIGNLGLAIAYIVNWIESARQHAAYETQPAPALPSN